MVWLRGKNEENGWSGKCRTFRIGGSFPKRQPKKTGNEVIRNYLKEQSPRT